MEKNTSAKKPVEAKPVPQPKKRLMLDESVERTVLGASITTVLSNPKLNIANYRYIDDMHAKLGRGKRLTPNEIQGLSKIQRALQHVAKGTYKTSGKA